MGEVTILVDIDGVLAEHNYRRLFDNYNQSLKLTIPDDQLEDLSSLDDFQDLAQVQTYKANVGENRFAWQIEALQWHPRYIVHNSVIDRALFGVKYLARKADDLGYCTARFISFNEQWNRELAASTQLWLKQQDFPHYSQVLFCNGVKAKLEGIAECLREQQETSIILIDDSAEELLEAFADLTSEDQDILIERLTLVAFGYVSCESTAIRTIPFPSWGKVMDLTVEKEFDYGLGKQQR